MQVSCRQHAVEAVHSCHRAGISTLAVCGASAATAAADGQLRMWTPDFQSHLLEVCSRLLPVVQMLLGPRRVNSAAA